MLYLSTIRSIQKKDCYVKRNSCHSQKRQCQTSQVNTKYSFNCNIVSLCLFLLLFDGVDRELSELGKNRLVGLSWYSSKETQIKADESPLVNPSQGTSPCSDLKTLNDRSEFDFLTIQSILLGPGRSLTFLSAHLR